MILIVEDEMLIALNESMTLEKNGYNTLTAISGEEAVDTIRSGVHVDLILMDINLGQGIDGTAAAEMILDEIDIPLIFMSSHTEKQIVDKTEGITSYGYIVKNSGETVMLTSINMAFKLYDAKKAEFGILKAASIWEKTINSINDCILLIDTDNRIINYNDAFSEFVGGGDEDLRGRRCMELTHGTTSSPHNCPFNRMKKTLKRERSQIHLKGRQYDVIADPLFNEKGELEGAVHILSDISTYKRGNEKLERKIEILTSPELLQANFGFEDLFNLERIQKLQDDFAGAYKIASIITLPDGTPITNSSNFSRFCFDFVRSTPKGFAKCSKSDALLGRPSSEGPTIQKCLSCGLWDAGAGITVGGRHIANWLIGQVRDDSITEEDVRDRIRELGIDEEEAIAAFYELPKMSNDEFRRISELLYTMAESLSELAYRNFQQARMISRISESEEQIKSLLEQKNKLLDEKNLLLKEVHHRVKNNISSLSALLTMQLDFTKEPEAVNAIKDAIGRVNSTRVLYEKLLKSDGYNDLPVRQFVEDIIEEISRIFPEKSRIKIFINIDEFVLGSELMFPLGIIINEFITNIYKYAFAETDEGEIRINIQSEKEYTALEIVDNGKGFPEGFSVDNSVSYGLKLVKMLAMQINGDLSISNKEEGQSGAVCRVKIKSEL